VAQVPSPKIKKLLTLLIGALTLALYLPAVRHEFLTYDDQQYVTENPHVQSALTVKGLMWAFGFHASNWHPLTWISHMLDCQIFGLHAAGHHFTSALLHTTNTVLLFLILSSMTGALWRSAMLAALFGWHPLHVESVAWVAERKDGLCGFFWIATLWAYRRYTTSQDCGKDKLEIRNPKSEGNPKSWYCLTLFTFALALMSKPMAVTLPFVLLLLDCWPLRRLQLPIINYQFLSRLLLEKVPFLVLSAIACVLTIQAQSQAHAVVSTAGLPMFSRIGHALLSYLHYIGAIFWPRHLAVYYPYERATPSMVLIGAALVLAVITVIAIRFARKSPYLLVGWLWFLGTLVPVIGLVQVGEQAWADRYTYLPSIGLLLATVWGFAEIFQARDGAVGTPRPTSAQKVGRGWQDQLGLPTAPVIVTVAFGMTLLTLTFQQLRYWKNTRALFEHAVAVTQKNYMAVTLLGSLLAKDGNLNEAIERYNTALSWKPDYPEAHFFLGNAFDRQGKLDEAIAEYKQALSFKPMHEQAHIFLGAALAKKRQFDEAVSHYSAALKLNPESAVAHNNLARVFQTEGRIDEAMEHYSAAVKLDPGLAQAHNNLGVLMLAKDRTTEGVRELREAMRLNPSDAESEYNLALALNQEQQWNEAAELLATILKKRPNDPNAHYQFAVALTHLHKTREALSHYASALLIQPDFSDALDGLAWILSTSVNPSFRNGPEAVQMAERACVLTNRKDAQKLKTLAAAYAEAGRFAEAVSTIQSAVALGTSSSNSNAWASMLSTYKSGQPWREPETK
jgi:tetratricopeptide (TPR) repeat protein